MIIALYIVTFLVSFASIVYELLLGQSLSAFLGDTVLRYSITIGLYLFSMGLGSFAAKNRGGTAGALVKLQTVELLLALAGGFSIVLLHLLDFVLAGPLFFAAALGLVAVIGFLTGFELPLLIDLAPNSSSQILAWSYAGAFAGSLGFALLFFPLAGLTLTALISAVLNAIAGLLLGHLPRAAVPVLPRIRAAQYAVFFLFVALLFVHRSLSAGLETLYLAASR